MNKIILYSFLFAMLQGVSQNVYHKVRKNLSYDKPANELYTIDSCYNAGYYKDSALFYKAMVNLKIGNSQSAKKNVKALVKLSPDFKELHYLNGLLYFSEQNYGKCVDEFNLAVKDNPKNVKVYYNRSIALGLMDEYLAAIEDLNTCIELNPAYTLALYSRAYWYEYTGNYEESTKDYESTIKLDPKNYDAYLGLAYVCQTQKKTDKACEAINQAIKEGSQIAMELKEIFCK